MATIVVTKDLDVVEKYKELISSSLDGSSIYIRTKETLEELFRNSNFTEREKAEILSQVLVNLNSTVVTSSMSTAMQWASNEKDIELRKLELALQLDILEEQKALTKQQAANAYYDGVARQAETRRMFGVPVVVDGVLTGLSEEGKVLEDTKLVIEQTANAQAEHSLLGSRLNESYAAIHKTVADTVVNYGPWTYTIGADGVTSSFKGTTPVVPLSDVQRAIAKEQARGYAWNAWANAATASAGMLGTAIASDGAISNITELTNIWKDAVENLKNVTAPTAFN